MVLLVICRAERALTSSVVKHPKFTPCSCDATACEEFMTAASPDEAVVVLVVESSKELLIEKFKGGKSYLPLPNFGGVKSGG